MKATKKQITIDYLTLSVRDREELLSWSTKKNPIIVVSDDGGNTIYVEIRTLEGTMKASDDDVIIKGINGEVYPCKKDIFDKTYDTSPNN